jgi:DNA-binding CsgD family transcriptional regulator/pimeloyl-ACP methyl ester carboxylesterase
MTDAPDHEEHFLDRVYQIALDPSHLDAFIEFWHETDLAAQTETPRFDDTYKSHLTRAGALLQRAEGAQTDLDHHLQPFDNLAALIVNSALQVEAMNTGAQTSLRAQIGASLSDIQCPPDVRDALLQTVKDVLFRPSLTERLLKVDASEKSGFMLFRVMRLDQILPSGPAVLIASTLLHLQDTLPDLLKSVFHLTEAEQSIVGRLTEGQTAKQIAQLRGVSEGTVRGQIKSILGKMNVGSQSDIIRLTLTLNKFPKGITPRSVAGLRMAPSLSEDWLDAEVWKPFNTCTLPDGRSLVFHDMGPATGTPILFSHMGSCMVRWTRPMLKQAYAHNLRIICPIRAGYGHSDPHNRATDVFDATRADVWHLLTRLGLSRLPYAVQGSDLPFGVDLAAHCPDMISELICIGGQMKLPGGRHLHGTGHWQRFFVSTAQTAPNMVRFASKAVMAMSKRIGPEAMLRQLCKDSAADLASLDDPETANILAANLSLMASKDTNSAEAFMREYIAFQRDWTGALHRLRDRRIQVFLAEEDPTINLGALPQLQNAYPWIEFTRLPQAGLALMYQKHPELIPVMADAAKRAAQP